MTGYVLILRNPVDAARLSWIIEVQAFRWQATHPLKAHALLADVGTSRDTCARESNWTEFFDQRKPLPTVGIGCRHFFSSNLGQDMFFGLYSQLVSVALHKIKDSLYPATWLAVPHEDWMHGNKRELRDLGVSKKKMPHNEWWFLKWNAIALDDVFKRCKILLGRSTTLQKRFWRCCRNTSVFFVRWMPGFLEIFRALVWGTVVLIHARYIDNVSSQNHPQLGSNWDIAENRTHSRTH